MDHVSPLFPHSFPGAPHLRVKVTSLHYPPGLCAVWILHISDPKSCPPFPHSLCSSHVGLLAVFHKCPNRPALLPDQLRCLLTLHYQFPCRPQCRAGRSSQQRGPHVSPGRKQAQLRSLNNYVKSWGLRPCRILSHLGHPCAGPATHVSSGALSSRRLSEPPAH